ncbi:spore protease [Ammonifex degensii KC4]|uniref:Germination protease n=1 Tax=Ammonifex degensii (strain DSM 10501 / KC4) TaxID=429009 RepID=C9RAM1_AMMDK|nr:GPR endopeptidase [Ammonifex degensii]ACX51298.1 spore protease [Ammonifex degensii KC4]
MLDLAVEAHDLARARTGKEIPGVRVEKEEHPYALVTTVQVETEEAERLMQKPKGTYITIESSALLENNRQIHQELIKLLGEKLSLLLKDLPETASALIVGLGNWHATPDALGPRTVDYTLVTRHLFHYAPQELRGGLREVSALAPGVLGTTGIETAEIIRGVVEKIKPDVVITIDALAARSVARIATSIQLADTGISPGSGIGNDRAGINRETMGVPVIAVGVPTVVHAAFIAQDAMERLWQELNQHPRLREVYKYLHPELVQRVIDQLLAPFGGRLMVTPKEIDTLVQNTARILAGGLAVALHPGMNPEEAYLYL